MVFSRSSLDFLHAESILALFVIIIFLLVAQQFVQNTLEPNSFQRLSSDVTLLVILLLAVYYYIGRGFAEKLRGM